MRCDIRHKYLSEVRKENSVPEMGHSQQKEPPPKQTQVRDGSSTCPYGQNLPCSAKKRGDAQSLFYELPKKTLLEGTFVFLCRARRVIDVRFLLP